MYFVTIMENWLKNSNRDPITIYIGRVFCVFISGGRQDYKGEWLASLLKLFIKRWNWCKIKYWQGKEEKKENQELPKY